MAIEKGRVVAGSTIETAKHKVWCLPIYTSLPFQGQPTYRWNSQSTKWEVVPPFITPTYITSFESTSTFTGSLGAESTEQAYSGARSFKATGLYGSILFGSILQNISKRYDCWSFRLYPTVQPDTNYRIALGGSRDLVTSGAGYTIYTRKTGFGFYSYGNYTEVGTLPVITPNQWHHVMVQVDFGSNTGVKRKPVAASVWVDGVLAVNASWTSPWLDYNNESEARNFSFSEGGGTTAHDKYYDDFRLCQTDAPIAAMDAATITPQTVDSAIDSTFVVDPSNAEGLMVVNNPPSELASLYMGVNGQWRQVEISSQEIDPRTGKPWDPLAGFYNVLAS